jgi:hypothetical protein
MQNENNYRCGCDLICTVLELLLPMSPEYAKWNISSEVEYSNLARTFNSTKPSPNSRQARPVIPVCYTNKLSQESAIGSDHLPPIANKIANIGDDQGPGMTRSLEEDDWHHVAAGRG